MPTTSMFLGLYDVMVYGLCNQHQATHAGASRSIHGCVLLAQSPPRRLRSDSHHTQEAHFRVTVSYPDFISQRSAASHGCGIASLYIPHPCTRYRTPFVTKIPSLQDSV